MNIYIVVGFILAVIGWMCKCFSNIIFFGDESVGILKEIGIMTIQAIAGIIGPILFWIGLFFFFGGFLM